jgi:hypothetical protein
MPLVVSDVHDQLVPDLLGVVAATHKFQLDYKLVLWKQEIHSSARIGVARRELLGPDVRNPGPQKSVEQVLNVVLRGERKRLRSLSPMSKGCTARRRPFKRTSSNSLISPVSTVQLGSTPLLMTALPLVFGPLAIPFRRDSIETHSLLVPEPVDRDLFSKLID